MEGASRRIGVAVWIGAGVAFALAGLVLLVSALRLSGQTEADNASAEALCLQRLRSLGTAERTGDRLRLVVPKVTTPRAGIEDASALAAVCPGWTLSYFCMGTACGEGAVVKMIVEMSPAHGSYR